MLNVDGCFDKIRSRRKLMVESAGNVELYRLLSKMTPGSRDNHGLLKHYDKLKKVMLKIQTDPGVFKDRKSNKVHPLSRTK